MPTRLCDDPEFDSGGGSIHGEDTSAMDQRVIVGFGVVRSALTPIAGDMASECMRDFQWIEMGLGIRCDEEIAEFEAGFCRHLFLPVSGRGHSRSSLRPGERNDSAPEGNLSDRGGAGEQSESARSPWHETAGGATHGRTTETGSTGDE